MDRTEKKLFSRWLPVTFLLLSAIGLADATYLAITHYREQSAVCLITEGCDRVLQSQYATLAFAFHIPTALAGVLYYGILLVFIIVYLRTKNQDVLLLAARGTIVGFLASLWFVYLQIFTIKALCAYCLLSAFISTMLFALGTATLLYERKFGRAEVSRASA
ncbi:MAG: vitamin K epoxide reductase family protein [Patescibacteria group bacterium]